MTTMLLSRVHHPVRNLGFGRRAGIWFQGCTVWCRGCVSRDSWPFDPAAGRPVEDVLAWIRSLPDDQVDGVTISGGEPTDQPEALAALLTGLQRWRSERTEPADILLYSGRDNDRLDAEFPWLRESVDTLVTGPFDATRAGGCALRGSDNQQVHTTTALGRSRYPAETVERDYSPQRGQLGVHVDHTSIWLVGIPLPGDLRKLENQLTERGVELTRTSWLT